MSLPVGWVTVPLKELTSKIGSGATPRGGREAYGGGEIPLIRSMNVHFAGFDPEGLAFLSQAQADALSNVAVEEGDVLLNITGASIGRVCLAPPGMAGARVNQHVCIIRLQEVLAHYVQSYLASPVMQQFILSENYGLTRQALTKSMIEDIGVPLPPLAEQRRIVARLDALTARLARARAELDRVPVLARRLREQAVEAALCPKLKADQEWQTCRFGDLVSDGPSNGWSPKSSPSASGALTLKLTATTSGRMRLDDAAVKRIDEVPDDASSLWLCPGDLLIQRANALEHVGATAIFDGPVKTFIYPDLMMRVRFDDPRLTRLMWYRLNSKSTRQYFRENATGTAGNMPKISGKTLKNMVVAIPPAEMWDAVLGREPINL